MASRQIAWQWDRAKLFQAVDELDRFVRLAGLDDQLAMLEEAARRCRLDVKTLREHVVAREVARALMKRGNRLFDVRRVVAWREPGTAEGVRIEIEYGDSVVEPLLTR